MNSKERWIPMKDLKKRNVFEYKGRIIVAAHDAFDGYVWLTTPELYEPRGGYSYTGAGLEEIEDIEVKLIAEDVEKYNEN